MASCRREQPAVSAPDPAVISGYTSGVISSRSVIRVRFAEPQVEAARSGQEASPSPLSFEPRIRGRAVWAAPDLLEYRPEIRLAPGQDYAATLRLAGMGDFRFRFSVMPQTLNVEVEGLESASAMDLAPQILRGTLTTSDLAETAAVENALSAALKSRPSSPLPIEWEHAPDGLSHAFVVRGIQRQAQPEQVELKWDGRGLGVKKSGFRIVEVPPVEAFKVVEIRAVQSGEDYVLVRFSDPLRLSQNLAGLIWSPEVRDLRFSIQNNTVRVYSTTRFPLEIALNVEPRILNAAGSGLEQGASARVTFGTLAPAVRLPGNGTILPTTQGLVIPVETVNLRGIVVEAMQVYEGNVVQFLQVNDLDGQNELRRVGRVVWKKAIPIDWSPDRRNTWMRSGLDLSQLVADHPRGLYRMRVSFRRDQIAYPCGELAAEDAATLEAIYSSGSGDDDGETGFWSVWQGSDSQRQALYRDRKNPCAPGFYMDFWDHDIAVARNVLVSDIGLTARGGRDEALLIAAANLKSAEPMAGVKLRVLDFQQQQIAGATTDQRGFAQVALADRKPYLVVAEKDGQSGWLKLDQASALPLGSFDVGGAEAPRGLKGFLYGERGVWRPGDPIHLTFVLADTEGRLPANHPVSLRFYDPQGRLASSATRTEGVGGFYTFPLATASDAPTGYWRAAVTVGGAVFEQSVRVETIRPNRLRIALDFGGAAALEPGLVEATLSSSWLHGAPARGLKAEVEVSLRPQPTRFARFADYTFDDPVRVYQSETQSVFSGSLDARGRGRLAAEILASGESPGVLAAAFATRVFEPGGAASSDSVTVPFHPYRRYVGLRLPRGDAERGMLVTDTRHRADIVLVDPQGNPAGDGTVKVELYKVRWRWWWDKGDEELASYLGTSEFRPLSTDTVAVRNGVATWDLEVRQPAWGRYLVRVTDEQGGHATGRLVYIDWPGWAGRGQKEGPGGAGVLSFAADKSAYKVGDKATLTIPTPARGRLLVSIEAGGRVVSTEWVEARGESTRCSFDVTAAMAPNAYAHVSLLQPHMQTANDLPIRLYGILPIPVEDPRTRLRPVVSAPEVLRPEETATITVSESGGRAMAYTLAIVDEGLLGLTRFRTPDPWSHFYSKAATAVSTWDLYDHVAAAWGGTLEQMLAVGGSEELEAAGRRKADRFPPMVRFLGPFELAKGAKNSHAVPIPQYVGSVRIMCVAATRDGAYGHAEREVAVRKPLMVLADLPRVLSVGEEAALPVSVFALEPRVRDVTVELEVQGALAPVGEAGRVLRFAEPGDQLVAFRLRAAAEPGIGRITVRGASGPERASHSIEIAVRVPSEPVTDVARGEVRPGGRWTVDARPIGVGGSNRMTLEVSRIPPMDLERRLRYLITYPHGCVEQTTSTAFAQLFLDRLVDLAPERGREVQAHVTAAIERIARYQTQSGGFAFWLGNPEPDAWATSYAGHFLVEADRRAYALPPGLLARWKEHQLERALSWSGGDPAHAGREALQQAYRLYTLALAGQPALGAMNRLREARALNEPGRWLLAAAYHLAGQADVALRLAGDRVGPIPAYREHGGTYGSEIRDKAMILDAASIMGRSAPAEALLADISQALGASDPLPTQTVAYALLAVARHAGVAGQGGATEFALRWAGGAERVVSSRAPIAQVSLDPGPGAARRLEVRGTGDARLYTRLVSEGLPAPGDELPAAQGLTLTVRHTAAGGARDPETFEQGQDILAEVEVRNPGRSDYEQLALTQLVPSGWEIRPAAAEDAAKPTFDHQDVRDDRVLTYFSLKAGQAKVFKVRLNASFQGTFYMPMVKVEAMYDPTVSARSAGRWIRVVPPAP